MTMVLQRVLTSAEESKRGMLVMTSGTQVMFTLFMAKCPNSKHRLELNTLICSLVVCRLKQSRSRSSSTWMYRFW